MWKRINPNVEYVIATMEDDRFVKCPLVDEMIEDIDCIENVDAVDGRLKADKLPDRFKKKDDWETICKKCKWHNY